MSATNQQLFSTCKLCRGTGQLLGITSNGQPIKCPNPECRPDQ